jgi:hypothetical protein
MEHRKMKEAERVSWKVDEGKTLWLVEDAVKPRRGRTHDADRTAQRDQIQ